MRRKGGSMPKLPEKHAMYPRCRAISKALRAAGVELLTDEVFQKICGNLKLIAKNDPPLLKTIFEKDEIDFVDHWMIVLKAQALMREEVARTRQQDLDAMFRIR
jgi:hypothetical protein